MTHFNLLWGNTPTTMTRTMTKASGHTYHDTYQIADGTTFGMYRDHFDVRRGRGDAVRIVEDRPVVVQDDSAPTSSEDKLAAMIKAAEWGGR